MPQPANAADRIRAILADPAGQKDPNMQQIWLDEMAMIIDIIDRLGVMQRGPLAGVINGQAMIGNILGELKDEIVSRLDALIVVADAAQSSPPTVDNAAFIAELKASLMPPAPEAIKAAIAGVDAAITKMAQAMPLLLTPRSPTWAGLLDAIVVLQGEIDR